MELVVKKYAAKNITLYAVCNLAFWGFSLAIVSSLQFISNAQAHHSRAGFDSNVISSYEGIVSEVNWRNPHVYITVELASGGDWLFETDGIPILVRSGWSSDSISVGEKVIAKGNPGKNDQERRALLVSITKEDGVVLSPRSHFETADNDTDTQVDASATSMAGIWELPRGNSGSFLQTWGNIELTPYAITARDAFKPEDRPAGKCIGTPTPMIMAMPYLNEIELGDDVIYIRSEFLNNERVIYMDGREHPQNAARTNQGHSIGRWEGETLVIDTVLFQDHRAPIRGKNEGVPSGENKHVIEKYTLNDDGTKISIDFTVEDPEYLAEPFSEKLEWVYLPNYELSEFNCD
ncbi:MAG: DUF6152 family protein [Arenicellaceae bacterium]|nr:DUF6152 family protein [Arenicellaceae bacterium]